MFKSIFSKAKKFLFKRVLDEALETFEIEVETVPDHRDGAGKLVIIRVRIFGIKMPEIVKEVG